MNRQQRVTNILFDAYGTCKWHSAYRCITCASVVAIAAEGDTLKAELSS